MRTNKIVAVDPIRLIARSMLLDLKIVVSNPCVSSVLASATIIISVILIVKEYDCLIPIIQDALKIATKTKQQRNIQHLIVKYSSAVVR